ncbi:hypothetical protein [Serinicoccus chungangensis]|uniref:hypothetical protein n=1 Tax=Serinicoccus chungangensis TaxID=767452 RepID=UPI001118BC83|nr:hypothetical protein [Serinicoccus chungangensis]
MRHLRGEDTVSFFLPGEPDPLDRPWCHVDNATLSASAHPLLTHDVLCDQTGKSLREFVVNLRNDSHALERIAGPLSYLHHNVLRETIVAANDSLGIGKLYYATSGESTIVSNNPLAVALARQCAAVQDDEFWDAYYVTGGGLGDTSFIRGVTLAPPGSVLIVSQQGLAIREHHSVKRLLQQARRDPPAPRTALSAARAFVEELRPHLDSATLWLSGGLDSRLVTALALDTGLPVNAHTYVPPELEGQIARELHERAEHRYSWGQHTVNPGTVRQDARQPQSIELRPDPILVRAEAWFTYLGGDHWSSLVKSNPPSNAMPLASTFTLSGSHGDVTRGHYYGHSDVEIGAPEAALRRFLQSFTQYRAVLPKDLRERGSQLVRNALLEGMVEGFEGFYALDYMYLMNRVRRQFPPVHPAVILPLLVPEILTSTFWQPPREKVSAAVIRQWTNELMPSWRGVRYYHEAADGTDPAITNKVSVQSTYWETDETDFYAAMDAALTETGIVDVTMDDVRRELRSMPEGRNRTNQTCEFIFWHCAATRVLQRLNKVRADHP